MAPFSVLPLMILIPFLSIIPILLFDKKYSFKISIFFSFLTFLVTVIAVYIWLNKASLAFSIAYISSLNVNIQFQLTSLTSVLVLMAAIVFFASSAVGSFFIKTGSEKIYNVVFALVEGSSLGLFLSANLFLFYVFWEIAEIMMFFIIFIYGGYNKRYASIKFIIYSLASSLLLLIAILMIYTHSTPQSFDISSIIANAGAIPAKIQFTIMVLLLLSFMIKMPIFPLHGWLPDAHTEAPTTGSMILAGVLLKFGGYGLILMFMMLPLAAHYSLYIAMLAGFSAIYASLVAFRQANIKRIIAYSSITDMGIIAVGAAAINSFGTSGAVYSMLSHGIAISALFLLAGTLNELYGSLEIGKLRGVVRNFPVITYIFVIGSVALIGLPLTSGFVADLLIFIGSFTAFGLKGLIPISSIVILGALLFWVIERVFFGSKETKPYKEIDSRIIYISLFLIAATVFFGIFPFLFLS